MHADIDIADDLALAPATRTLSDPVKIAVTSSIAEIERNWRALEAFGVESPGQSYDFVSTWVEALGIPVESQVYLTAHAHGRPVMLLALKLVRRLGIRILTFIPGAHVGCNAPLIDTDWFAALDPGQRGAFWRRVFRALPKADAIFMPAVPEVYLDRFDLFAGLGRRGACDVLYRAQFSSWREADETMRKSKQRKRDRQQSEKLAALGEIAYGVATPDEYEEVVSTLFRQKAERFAALGIDDPFADPAIRRAYLEIVRRAKSLKPELFVLRLDGRIAAIRYALGLGDRLFALITSMSEDPKVQTGSPGRQEILRTVQTVFDRGYRVFDIGVSVNDEKRSWCNITHPVVTHYFVRSHAGLVWAWLHRLGEGVKYWIKSDEKRFALYRKLRARLPAALR